MARTKVCVMFCMVNLNLAAHRLCYQQQTARKSTGGESSRFLTVIDTRLTIIYSGKAPRKQLATKAARKTAQVSV
ncbi:hypothetical protein DFH11DRAFT_555160 [Phellopilus nigrolimitatus]|nr:hypothetical protein DFH11DRAFT_555160 [Phellopilus nigrolimitatus]